MLSCPPPASALYHQPKVILLVCGKWVGGGSVLNEATELDLVNNVVMRLYFVITHTHLHMHYTHFTCSNSLRIQCEICERKICDTEVGFLPIILSPCYQF